MNHRERIIRELADQACQRVCHRVIRLLQGIDGALSGDDSGLDNAWDEICVQVQDEQSFYWDTYLETIRDFVRRDVEALPPYELQAMWLQTEPGWNWSYDHTEDEKECPAVSDDVAGYLIDNQILDKASNWSNRRIRRYIENKM